METLENLFIEEYKKNKEKLEQLETENKALEEAHKCLITQNDNYKKGISLINLKLIDYYGSKDLIIINSDGSKRYLYLKEDFAVKIAELLQLEEYKEE